MSSPAIYALDDNTKPLSHKLILLDCNFIANDAL